MASTRSRLLLVLVAVATVGAYVVMFVLSTTSDAPDRLDVDPVPGAASRACTQLRADLDALPPLPAGATQSERQERLRVEDAAVRRLVDDVRRLGEPALRADLPAEDWLSDWTTLADARDAYAASGATGPFTPPLVEGRPVNERMGRIGLDACVVPTALTTAP